MRTSAPSSTASLAASDFQNPGIARYYFNSPGGSLTSYEDDRISGNINFMDYGMMYRLGGIIPPGSIVSATLTDTIVNAQSREYTFADLLANGFRSDHASLTQADLVAINAGTFYNAGYSPSPFVNPVTTNIDVLTLVRGAGPYVGFIFHSGDYISLGGRPTLTITFDSSVPEPSSLALCGLAGLIGLAGSRLRRRGR